MEIIKDNTGWLDDDLTTYFDDVAYHLYQKEHMKKKEAMVPQWHMVKRAKVFHEYYDKAKLMIRIERLNKIKNNLENK